MAKKILLSVILTTDTDVIDTTLVAQAVSGALDIAYESGDLEDMAGICNIIESDGVITAGHITSIKTVVEKVLES